MERLRDLSSSYGLPQRCLAQILLSRRLVKLGEVALLFKGLCLKLGKIDQDFNLPADGVEARELVDGLMRCMNDELRDLGYRLQLVCDEFQAVPVEYMTMVSDRPHSGLLATLSGLLPDEIALFQHWLKLMYAGGGVQDDDTTRLAEAIGNNRRAGGATNRSTSMDTGYYDVGSVLDASQLSGQFGELRLTDALANVGNLTKNQARKYLKRLIDMNWLVQVQEPVETIRLHRSALAELSSRLRTTYDLPACRLCKATIYVGRLAHQCRSCENHVHARCIKKCWTLPMQCPFDGCSEWLDPAFLHKFDFDPAEGAESLVATNGIEDGTRNHDSTLGMNLQRERTSTRASASVVNNFSHAATSSRRLSSAVADETSTQAFQGSSATTTTGYSAISASGTSTQALQGSTMETSRKSATARAKVEVVVPLGGGATTQKQGNKARETSMVEERRRSTRQVACKTVDGAGPSRKRQLTLEEPAQQRTTRRQLAYMAMSDDEEMKVEDIAPSRANRRRGAQRQQNGERQSFYEESDSNDTVDEYEVSPSPEGGRNAHGEENENYDDDDRTVDEYKISPEGSPNGRGYESDE